MVQLVKKKVDSRIRTLVENGVKSNHRSFFVIVGDRGKDQVMYLHYMLSKARVAVKPSVLWCYKKELSFSNHRKKRIKQQQNMLKKGLKEVDSENPFELFVASTNIRYCYYKETQKILGNTYGMCVLQDFEALTPNLLARTVETVEGGGIVVILLRSMTSLKQLYTLSMDVHARYRTESHADVVGRFNERFMLSLSDCMNCLVVDDELNILPISAGKSIIALPKNTEETDFRDAVSTTQQELKDLKESFKDTVPVYALVEGAKTLDQGKAILTFIEAISDKSLSSTVTLTAARGRGKSAALGISIASAVTYGYSNIFVTSPSPENLKTLFEFVLKTFDGLGYQEHLDFDIVQSTNPDFNKAIVRINIYKNHRQTIQYIQPQDSHVLGQAELVVIDEAAAIPLPLVKKLMGPYLVFMASTINGYEGTGRSLSLKLIQQLREQSRGLTDLDAKAPENVAQVEKGINAGGRVLREIKLEEPIRYSEYDPTEKWLNKLLCLDASVASSVIKGCPHPKDCQLYYVNRDTLFSYHGISEAFLQRMMALYVSSHYKNTPNDLQLMSDAPSHHLFVLLPPISEEDDVLPEPLVVIQVCLEGKISHESILASLSRGKRADGDLIPWNISQQYQDDDFGSLSGARVVRIATHPDYSRMGYGSRAMSLLIDYYEGKLNDIGDTENVPRAHNSQESNMDVTSDIHTEKLKVRDVDTMAPLLLAMAEIPAPPVHWIGVSFGLTHDLMRFWKKSRFMPLYIRQTPNDLTGEHSCIMVRTLEQTSLRYDPQWLTSFFADFRQRFLSLLGFQFRDFSPALSLSVLESSQNNLASNPKPLTVSEVGQIFSAYDLKRLSSYANNMLDYHVITDMLPLLGRLIFLNRFANSGHQKGIEFSVTQKAIILGMGLQYKNVEQVASELNLPVSQVLALFAKTLRKLSEYFEVLKSKKYADEMDQQTVPNKSNDKKEFEDDEAWNPTEESLEADLDEASKERMLQLKEKQREVIDSFDMSQYEIAGDDEHWTSALKKHKGTLVSIKNPKSSKQKYKEKSTMQDVLDEGKKLVESMKKKRKK